MKNIFRRSMTITILLSLIVLGGCETMRGVGKDMKRAGNWIEREANK